MWIVEIPFSTFVGEKVERFKEFDDAIAFFRAIAPKSRWVSLSWRDGS